MTALQASRLSPAKPPTAPFDLAQPAAYRQWRDAKLAGAATAPADLQVGIADPRQLTPAEHAALAACIDRNNMAIYQLAQPELMDKPALRRFAAQLGLQRLDHNMGADEDSITSLRVVSEQPQRGYIPYSNRPLNWHTDGYYNPPARTIRAVILHCHSPAAAGGDNGLIDHELIYLQLRDEAPELVAALMQPDAMSIPANVEGGTELRELQTGPVFSVEPATGRLHMRYTARQRNVIWRDDPLTQRAASRLRELMQASPWRLQYRLQPGEGLVSNNVLHCREPFEDNPDRPRLLYRARYYDAIDTAAIHPEA